MATPNYSYEKRQRELEKKRKKEEKLKRKVAPEQRAPRPSDGPDSSDPLKPGTGSNPT